MAFAPDVNSARRDVAGTLKRLDQLLASQQPQQPVCTCTPPPQVVIWITVLCTSAGAVKINAEDTAYVYSQTVWSGVGGGQQQALVHTGNVH